VHKTTHSDYFQLSPMEYERSWNCSVRWHKITLSRKRGNSTFVPGLAPIVGVAYRMCQQAVAMIRSAAKDKVKVPQASQRGMNWLGGRHADEIIRIVVFLVIGGTVSLGNLVCVWMLSHQHFLPYIVYVTIATELSIFASFLLNDRVTFRSLAIHGRAWYLRFFRFHSAAAVGAIVTVTISTTLYHAIHLRPVIAQFIAITIATALNFSMHRFWTYRGLREPGALQNLVDAHPETIDWVNP